MSAAMSTQKKLLDFGANNKIILDAAKYAVFLFCFFSLPFYLMPPGTFVYFVCMVGPGLVYGFGTMLVWMRARGRPGAALTDKDLHISVLKPMCDLDPRLEENLESFANLSAPDQFKVFMCFARESDTGYPVAAEFAKRHPQRFRLIVGSEPGMANPKISQLVHAMKEETKSACNPFVWVSESNVETSQEFMENLAKTYKQANSEGGGQKPTMVHAAIVGVFGSGIGARMERMCLSSEFNPFAEIASFFDKFGCIGKTVFFGRDDIEQVGGLQRFGNVAGEDHLMGEAFYRHGRLICCSMATRNVLGDMPATAFFNRHSRWAVMRRSLQTSAFVIEPLISVMWPAFFCVVGMVPGWCVLMWLVGRGILDFVNHMMLVGPEDIHVLDMLAVPLKEVLLAAAWIRAVFVRTVNWRGHVYTMAENSSLTKKTN